MKKFLIIVGAVIFLLIAAIIGLPIIYKDDIKNAMDEAIAESLNAQVFYDVGQFDLSLIKNFPDFTVSLGDFGVVGIDEFEKDTLASIESFEITMGLTSVISGDQIKIEEVLLNRPKISIVVLEDGKANYDIAKISKERAGMVAGKGEKVSAEGAANGLRSTVMREWAIYHVVNYDLGKVSMQEVEAGKDEQPSTTADSELSIEVEKWVIMEGQVTYTDLSENIYTSLIGLNHAGSGDFTLDISDLTTNTVIESASLGYDGIRYVSNKRIKADVILNMNLPKMQFSFKDNQIAINDFAISANGDLQVAGDDIHMNLTFEGNDINLKRILSLIPGAYQEYLDGITAGGTVNFDGLVKGTFNSNSMPKVAANLSVDNGSIRYSDYDIPIDEVNIKADFDYPSADLRETRFNIEQFSMLVDGEKFESYLKLKDLENYTWNFGFDGHVDLEKITKIVPLEGEMALKGKVNAGIRSSGKMSDLEAEKYENLPTEGSLTVKDFYFASPDLPQGLNTSKVNMTFKPEEIVLDRFYATSGNSDFSLAGKVSDYLDFALSKNESLTGTLDLQSNLLDINEFIPEYDLKIKDLKGKVAIKDGAILLEENSFNMLDGAFEMTGSYVTKNLDQPKYDLKFKIKDLSIASAFESFSVVQQYVPIAKHVTGTFSSEFVTDGLLGSDMMPVTDAVNVDGRINIAKATLNTGNFITKLNSLAALKSGSSPLGGEKSISLENTLIKIVIKEGRLSVEPFDLKVRGQEATVGGSNTLDGKLNYSMLIKEIPTGAVGNVLNSALSSLTGGKNLVSDKMDIALGIGGTYDDINVSLLGASPSNSSGQSSPKEVFKRQITSKIAQEKDKTEAELAKKKAEAETKAKAELEAKKKAAQDSIKAIEAAAKEKLENKAKKKVKSLFKKGGGE
ncbi:MAG: hypothetical protein OXH57_02240 [Ekhidna sp.]|nr:hypothetical protein [Ekhidna sp.]